MANYIKLKNRLEAIGRTSYFLRIFQGEAIVKRKYEKKLCALFL